MAASNAQSMSIERHPDIMALRDRYDFVGGSPAAQVAEGLLFLSAGYTAASAWIVGFNGVSSALTVANLIAGVAVMVLTMALAAAYGRTHGLAWVAPVIGIWTIIAPWAVQNTDRTTALLWSNIVAGACMTVFGLVVTALAARVRAGRRAEFG